MLRAASTYSIWESASVCARITLALPAQETRVRAKKIFTIPCPSVYITTIARRSEGKAMVTSASLIMKKSVFFPRNPLNIPSTVPNSREIRVGKSPMASETLAP